ncbi:hypothetical protein BJY52DRAFT_785412 [Lactarius psammicola]|nr:hypothetical protein BJY52DRAFT_785412 [Lactarius psammicola]
MRDGFEWMWAALVWGRISGLDVGKEGGGCKWWCGGVGAKLPSRLYGKVDSWELLLRLGRGRGYAHTVERLQDRVVGKAYRYERNLGLPWRGKTIWPSCLGWSSRY